MNWDYNLWGHNVKNIAKVAMFFIFNTLLSLAFRQVIGELIKGSAESLL
jgi:hypothetical protein